MLSVLNEVNGHIIDHKVTINLLKKYVNDIS